VFVETLKRNFSKAPGIGRIYAKTSRLIMDTTCYGWRRLKAHIGEQNSCVAAGPSPRAHDTH
jgi:hypothetical protein